MSQKSSDWPTVVAGEMYFAINVRRNIRISHPPMVIRKRTIDRRMWNIQCSNVHCTTKPYAPTHAFPNGTQGGHSRHAGRCGTTVHTAQWMCNSIASIYLASCMYLSLPAIISLCAQIIRYCQTVFFLP